MLIVIMGLPGSGKSYFSKALAEELGCVHINSDIIRKTLSSQAHYTADDKKRVYQVMFETVCRSLLLGDTVIADATFSLESYRSPYFDFAAKNGIPLYIILIEANETTIIDRIKKPRPDSDADFEVYQKIKAEFAPINRECLQLASDELSLDQMISRAKRFIRSKPHKKEMS